METSQKKKFEIVIPRNLVWPIILAAAALIWFLFGVWRDTDIRNKINEAYPCGEDADTQEEIDYCRDLNKALFEDAKKRCFKSDVDCQDIGNREDAQSTLELCKVVRGSDIYNLDADHDGEACESLK